MCMYLHTERESTALFDHHSRINSHNKVISCWFIFAFPVLGAVASLGPVTYGCEPHLGLRLIDVQMLQRQIMFKQLQELQRRQQVQELGGARNQDYADEQSLKQASTVQYVPTVNGAAIRDSRMLTFDNMQTIEQGEPSIFQGFPNGHSNALGPIGMSPPQSDMSLYSTPAPNADKDFYSYSYLQGPSNYSANPSAKNNNSPLGMSSMHPSAITSSFMSQQGNFSADQSPVSDSSFSTYQMYQERNLFGEVPFHSSNSNLLSVTYSSQGITTQRSTPEGRLENMNWRERNSPGEVSRVGMSKAAASLDPLEQKILYNSDDHGWLSSFGTNNQMSAGDFECTVENPSFMDSLPSVQSGSWIALMQSAVTETSSSDTAVQEEWSGLSFQNPEPSTDNQHSNWSNGEKRQDNWVDRNLQNISSPSSEPEQLFLRQNMNNYPGLEHSGKQYLKQNDEYQCESSHVSSQCSPRNINQTDYNSQLKNPAGKNQLVQTSLLSEDTWPPQCKENLKTGHELKDTCWHSNTVSGGSQTPFDQLNQPNYHKYLVDSELKSPGDNVDPLSAHLNSSDPYGQNVAAQSTLPSSQGFVFRVGPADSRSPQSYSLFPSLPMGNSNVKSLPNSYEHPSTPVPNNMTTESPAYSDPSSSQMNFQVTTSSHDPRFSLSENVAVTQPSGMSVSSQHVGFLTGLPPPGAELTSQQDVPSPRANKSSSSLFWNRGSASSSLENNSQAPVQVRQNFLKHEHDVGYHEQRLENDIGTPVTSANVCGDFDHCLHQNHALLRQLHQSRDGQTDYGSRYPINYQQVTTNARDPLLSGQDVAVKVKAINSLDGVQLGAFTPGNDKENFIQEAQEDQSVKASSTNYLCSFQQMETFGKNDYQNHSIDNKEASNTAYQPQISLQMAPSWFKQYGNLKNGQALPTCDPKNAITSIQPFSGLSIGNFPENRLIMQVDSNTVQGSGICRSSAANLKASEHLSPPSMLPSDVTYRDLDVSNLKKRKIVAFDLVPWHKKISCEAIGPQNIMSDCTKLNRVVEFEWTQALDRRQEEARNEAEVVDDVHPVVRAKRRLIFTTQLIQQVFRPSTAAVLFGEASSNYDYVAYSAAITALGDACNLNSKMPSDSNNVLHDKLKTWQRTTLCNFSNNVKCLINQAEKLEGDLSRMVQSLSVVDIKLESQELEKFSTLNRFAKFHFKVHPSIGDPSSSSGSSTTARRYVIAVQMPNTLPEGRECLSL